MNPGTLPDLTRYHVALNHINPIRLSGRVVQVVGLTIEVTGLDCQIGEVCEIRTNNSTPLLSEVVGFRDQRTLLMPLGEMQGIQPGSPIIPLRTTFQVAVGDYLLGRVLDGLGRPIDSLGDLEAMTSVPTYHAAPHPLNLFLNPSLQVPVLLMAC
jgi:flagellum-specific ATP synthase